MNIRSFVIAAALATPCAASAEMPIFSAKCLENNVDADRTGTVRVNGMAIPVTAFNENYYEASIESMTYSISHSGGGRDLTVTFSGSGGVNGICQVIDVVQADGGASTGAGMAPGETRTEVVHFQKGASSATLTTTLPPGGSVRYVLGAAAGQDLYVTMGTSTQGVSYQIFNPDNTFLLDMVPFTTEYRGELWQKGDHVVEVINRAQDSAYVTVTMSID